MGGNALAAMGAKRVDRDTAFAVADRVSKAISKIAENNGAHARCLLIPAYREKPDFGDLDFVLDNSLYQHVSRDKLVSGLEEIFESPLPNIKNGPVHSVGIPLQSGGFLQVDLIGMAPETVQAAVDYFSWNDLGNLVGRIAHKMGLKYGHDGLSIVLRDGTHQFDSISVSRNTDAILSFLGYDPVVWNKGFDNREQIYRFVVDTPFFNKAIYNLDNRNHIARVREKKRPVYMEFLSWVEQPPFVLNAYQFPEDKRENLPRLFEAFPGIEAEYNEKWRRLEDSKYLKSRFNASIVTAVTGVEGRELGEFMAYFKKRHMSRLESIRSMSDGDVRTLIEAAKREMMEPASDPTPD